MESEPQALWQNWWVRGIGASLIVEALTRLIFETGWITALVNLLIKVELRVSLLTLLLSAVLVGLIVWRLAIWILEPDESSVDERDYTRDLIYSVVWEWNQTLTGLTNLTAICPECGRDLEEKHRSPSGGIGLRLVALRCGPCDNRWETKSSGLKKAVKKEIKKRIRTGEWKDAIEEVGTKDDPLPVPLDF